MGKPEKGRPLGRRWHRCDIDINMDIKQWNGKAWTGWIWVKLGMGGGMLWRW